ncbi:MAG: hypothetical protein OEX02_10230 [Cyclobacteriaceae bacterium]|nr:hypothetical protein [Cyclobacteriaceae bacterium]
MKRTILFTIILLEHIVILGQRVPNQAENMDYLVLFGKDALPASGDDDHVQILFFTVPQAQSAPVYIRIYDPDTGGLHDEQTNVANTKCRYSVYGGEKAFSQKESRYTDPIGEYKSGNILATRIFGDEKNYDNKWFTLGPFNPTEGELVEEMGGRVFKVIIEGLTGDDGNAYRLFLSVSASENISVQGGNAFAFEYTVKLPKNKGTSHIYPFVSNQVISVTQNNFDFDQDGQIMIYSIAKNRHAAAVSGDNVWASSKHPLQDEEKNTTIDIQLLKTSNTDNTVSFYVTNQYNEALPFFAIPLGGAPTFDYKLSIKYR